MASTNKTTHYDLSQYIGSDKPTYLVDYNNDMSNIDTGIYDAQNKANQNETNIGDLTNLNTSAKSNLVSAINELENETNGIGNLSNLTTEAQNNLVSAINEVDDHADDNNRNIGTMVNLETTNKSSLVGAINELNSKIPKTNTSYNNSSTETYATEYINQLNTYSATETVCGTWINGKPLYRKVVSLTLRDGFASSSAIQNADYLFIENAWIEHQATKILLPVANISANYNVRPIVNTNFVQVQNNNQDYVDDNCIIVLNYTKTTD